MCTHKYPRLSQLQASTSPKEVSALVTTESGSPDYTQGPTPFGKPGQANPKPNAALSTRLEGIPALVQDLFDSSRLLDLTQASTQDFNLVDSTVAIATDPQMAFELLGDANQIPGSMPHGGDGFHREQP